MVKVHEFDTSLNAVTASYVDVATIKEGDILIVPSEKAVALVTDWTPIAFTDEYGEFAVFTNDSDRVRYSGKYPDSFRVWEGLPLPWADLD